MIFLENVSKSFDGGQTFILENFSLEVQRGETLILLGSSGCGKTTALKLINRLIEPSSGKIRINQQDTQHLDPIQLRRSMGYVCQGIGLFPHMTVAENISIFFKLTKQPPPSQSQINLLLEKFSLKPDIYLDRYPGELSGGQQQRVGLARALISDPEIILMDEPFSALDAITRHEIQGEIIRLQKDNTKTIVFVTHDLLEALRLGDRIAIMHGGKLHQIGSSKDILQTPGSAFVEKLFANQAKSFRHLFEEIF